MDGGNAGMQPEERQNQPIEIVWDSPSYFEGVFKTIIKMVFSLFRKEEPLRRRIKFLIRTYSFPVSELSNRMSEIENEINEITNSFLIFETKVDTILNTKEDIFSVIYHLSYYDTSSRIERVFAKSNPKGMVQFLRNLK